MQDNFSIKICFPSHWTLIGQPRLARTMLLALLGLVVFGVPSVVSAWQTDARPARAPWRPDFGKPNSGANSIQPAQQNPPKQPGVVGTGIAGQTAVQPLKQPPASPNANPENPNQPPQRQQPKPGVTRVTKTFDKLPNDAGQVWREYDISPYTSEIKSTDEPQKAITDWILRETGTEMWFNQPLGILSAERNRLFVYHTPEIQAVVKGIVDRFVRTRGQIQSIDVNLVTVEDPNWRAQALTMLQPVNVRTPGVEAWIVSKENAAILMSQLSRRGDFKQHSGGRLTNHDGQTFVLEKKQPVQFVRNLQWAPNQNPGYRPVLTTINAGYRLAISSLSTLDTGAIEAVVKCDVDQVEKLTSVSVNVPTTNGSLGQTNLQIPQIVSWRLHERFRWPNDQVLIMSCGVVATPDPENSRDQGVEIPFFGSRRNRADALLFLEYRGPASEASVPLAVENRLAPINR